MGMGLGWLLRDDSDQVLSDAWRRLAYRPRHGKRPLALRSVNTAAAAIEWARERYMGAGDEDGLPGVLLADPPRARRIDMPNSS
jgi:hypothetical protein